MPGEFEKLSDDELERAIVERFARLGLALHLAISDGSMALSGAPKTAKARDGGKV